MRKRSSKMRCSHDVELVTARNTEMFLDIVSTQHLTVHSRISFLRDGSYHLVLAIDRFAHATVIDGVLYRLSGVLGSFRCYCLKRPNEEVAINDYFDFTSSFPQSKNTTVPKHRETDHHGTQKDSKVCLSGGSVIRISQRIDQYRCISVAGSSGGPAPRSRQEKPVSGVSSRSTQCSFCSNMRGAPIFFEHLLTSAL